MASVWPSGGSNPLLCIKNLDVEAFAARMQWEVFHGIEDGLGRFVSTGYAPVTGTPMVVIKYLDGPLHDAVVEVDRGITDFAGCENYLIATYFKGNVISWRRSEVIEPLE
jgi:hypothetical protein